MIENQNGVLSLVARNQVTTNMPIPYTARKAENRRNERNNGFCIN